MQGQQGQALPVPTSVAAEPTEAPHNEPSHEPHSSTLTELATASSSSELHPLLSLARGTGIDRFGRRPKSDGSSCREDVLALGASAVSSSQAATILADYKRRRFVQTEEVGAALCIQRWYTTRK